MIISCKLATTEYGAETFFQSQLVYLALSYESFFVVVHLADKHFYVYYCGFIIMH